MLFSTLLFSGAALALPVASAVESGAAASSVVAVAESLETALASLDNLFQPLPIERQLTIGSDALSKILSDAEQVLGPYNNTQSKTSTWMRGVPDWTPITAMNLPGCHDADSWSWTTAQMQASLGYMALEGETISPAEFLQCQQQSLVSMLNAGVRVLDLRHALDITNTTLNFFHGNAIFGQLATLDAVFFGLYQWLNDHPSEVIFVSFEYEGGTNIHAQNDAHTQELLYDLFTNTVAKKYVNPIRNEFGTLGEYRGQIVFLRRVDFDQVPAHFEQTIPGVHFSPQNWTDNDPAIVLEYNTEKHLFAYIEDNYDIMIPGGNATAEQIIAHKFNATTTNMLKAASNEFTDSLFWSFASGNTGENTPPVTPKILALGNGTELTPAGGMNQQLVSFFKTQRNKRLGICMFDFFDLGGPSPAENPVTEYLKIKNYV